MVLYTGDEAEVVDVDSGLFDDAGHLFWAELHGRLLKWWLRLGKGWSMDGLLLNFSGCDRNLELRG